MKTTSERWQSWTVVCAMVVCLLSCSGIATPVAEVARPDCGEIVREKPQTFYVSSQGPKGWIKDAQTLEDFRYAATNGFDYVTFEIGARRYPKGWLSSGLAAIAGHGHPWIVLRSRQVGAKSAVATFGVLVANGFDDSEVVVEADDPNLLNAYTKGHPSVRRVLTVELHRSAAKGMAYRSPVKKYGYFDDEDALFRSILNDCNAAFPVWGVRLPSGYFIVRPKLVERLHAAGLKVVMNNVNDPVTAAYYRRARVDGFVTANPAFTQGDGAWPTSEPKNTLLFGHRGGEDGLAPEHSPALTRLAVKHGLDLIKLDLHVTKDGEIVTSHDGNMKRVYGVNRAIASSTLAQLKELTAIPVGGYTNEHIQTLPEVLAIAKDGIGQFGLDFKAFRPAMAEKVLSITDAAGIGRDRLLVITYTLKALAYMKEHHPEIRRVMHTSVYYSARDGRWHVYQDHRGGVGVVAKDGEIETTYATQAEGCRRLIDFYKREYGLYGVNIGIYTHSDGPLERFRVSPACIAMLKDAGLWVSGYYPTDPVSCDYYRRAGVDAFITAAARDTVGPID